MAMPGWNHINKEPTGAVPGREFIVFNLFTQQNRLFTDVNSNCRRVRGPIPYNLTNPYSVFATRECRGIAPRINTLTGILSGGSPGSLLCIAASSTAMNQFNLRPTWY